MDSPTILDLLLGGIGAAAFAGIAVVVGLACIFLMRRFGVHFLYFAVILALLVAATTVGELPYFCAFVLGMATAFAEIISKFSDDPLKALKTYHALLYHVLNGCISAGALWILQMTVPAEPQADAWRQAQYVLLAGFGSMLVMRSRLFNVKVGEEDFSFGPEQVIKIYFGFMEDAIDRVRSVDRMRFVRGRLENRAFTPMLAYTRTMLFAAQAKEKAEREKILKDLEEIGRGTEDEQLKSYRLGFLLLNEMGEGFVDAFVLGLDPGTMIKAPAPGEKSLLAKIQSLVTSDPAYMAYGSNLNSGRLRERLNWKGIDAPNLESYAKPTRCVLEGYRLVFNMPYTDESGGVSAYPNLEPCPGERVEGVLYYLPREAMAFLDSTEFGYHRQLVDVSAGDKKDVKAQVYIADRTQEGLPPNRRVLELMVAGAREHALDASLVSRLEQDLAHAPVPTPAPAPVPVVQAAPSTRPPPARSLRAQASPSGSTPPA